MQIRPLSDGGNYDYRCRSVAKHGDRETCFINTGQKGMTDKQTYDQINISQLGRQAEIARATFNLHYDSLDDVLDSIIDDALEFAELSGDTVGDVLDFDGDRSAEKNAGKWTIPPASALPIPLNTSIYLWIIPSAAGLSIGLPCMNAGIIISRLSVSLFMAG